MKNDGSGGYFRGDKWIPITWGDKISDGLKNIDRVTIKCKECGSFFEIPKNKKKTTKWCSKDCQYKANYTNLKDPVKKKATIIGANLLMGQGKKAFLMALIQDAISSPCPYCGVTIDLQNLTVDHKEAYQSSFDRRSHPENKAKRRRLDRKENLHVVCKNCNQQKGKLHHHQYVRLVDFLETDPEMRDYIFWRLRLATAPFSRRRRSR